MIKLAGATSDVTVRLDSCRRRQRLLVREPSVRCRAAAAIVSRASSRASATKCSTSRPLGIAPELTAQPALNALMASGRGEEVRARARDIFAGAERRDLVWPVDEVASLLPVVVARLRRLLLVARSRHEPRAHLSPRRRAAAAQLAPPPGRVPRPERDDRRERHERRVARRDSSPTRATASRGSRPTQQLDFELEVGFLVGGSPATRIDADEADRHVFGAVLCNDWSARDIQSFEYQPLGPNLAKSFATTISPWVVTMDALRPYLVAAPPQEPAPDPYLRTARPWGIDIHLEVDLNGRTITETNFAGMYWTFAQQLAHITVNGATTRAGDLFASGTVSGADRVRARQPHRADRRWHRRRSFSPTVTRVTLRGWCGGGTRTACRVRRGGRVRGPNSCTRGALDMPHYQRVGARTPEAAHAAPLRG